MTQPVLSVPSGIYMPGSQPAADSVSQWLDPVTLTNMPLGPNNQNQGLTADALYLNVVKAYRAGFVNTAIRMYVGNVGQVGATLVRFGLYTFSPARSPGNLKPAFTLIARTANTPSALSSSFSGYTLSYDNTLLSSVNLNFEQEYAIGFVVVGASTQPQMYGQYPGVGEVNWPMGWTLAGQTDLPTFIAANVVSLNLGGLTKVSLA